MLHLPISRATFATRGVVYLALAAAALLPVYLIVRGLRFDVGTAADRYSNLAIAWLLQVPALAAGVLALRGVRWLLLAAWPESIGVWIGDEGIELRLDRGARRLFAWGALEVQWPEYLETLELDPDEPLPLPECPPILDRTSGRRVDAELRRFFGAEERLWWPAVEERVRAAYLATRDV
ncbi:MAG: hypothetical protein CHACPFDD_03373 [Phycisphaerae bacterium]|nr:hypothetical protein [Phycisphaerae bacterium]